MEKKKATQLLNDYGETVAKIVVKEVLNELSDLPRIPYNERRLSFWEKVKIILYT